MNCFKADSLIGVVWVKTVSCWNWLLAIILSLWFVYVLVCVYMNLFSCLCSLTLALLCICIPDYRSMEY